MSEPNLYWPVYRNLEKEFLELADYIHFSDDQLDTYSMFIADLLVRCTIEIEALSKELYSKLGGSTTPIDLQGNPRDLYFDTDCLSLLEQKWHLSKKQIAVSSINFYFTEEKNRILTPLHKAHKRGTSGSKWKQAYQAIKHDRKTSLKRASISNLIHALGALYILNLYYRDDRIDIGRVYLSDGVFDNRVGSEVFSAHYCNATCLLMQPHMDDSCISPPLEDKLDRAVFIVKIDDHSYKAMYKNFSRDSQVTYKRFKESPEIKQYLENHPEFADKSINEICLAAGGFRLLEQIQCFENTMADKSARLEAILNKHSAIYPEMYPLETGTQLYVKS